MSLMELGQPLLEAPVEKQPQQLRALLLKNASLQWRQPCTNCCQILTPIICLIFTILIRNVAIENIPSQNDSLYSKYPLVPLRFNEYSYADLFSKLVRRDKLQWLLFEVDRQADHQFIGTNDGLQKPSGMLSQVIKTAEPWAELNSSISFPFSTESVTVPCFRSASGSINSDLFNRYQFLNKENHNTIRSTSAIDKIPDGSIRFIEATSQKLNICVGVNDLRDLQYHRTNGLTRISLRSSVNSTYQTFFPVTEGMLAIVDMMSQAYIRTTKNATIVSGFIYMPFIDGAPIFVDMLINIVATIIFPLALSLLLPVFLYLIVLEKEEKLIQMMRMNGLKMGHYWLVHFLFSLGISLLTNAVFFVFGVLFLGNAFFTQTSLLLMIIVQLGWILSQIGMATLFQVFLSSSKVANIVGYLIAIWTNLVGATLSVALFQYPLELPVLYRLWPTFSFNRLFYLMFTYCSNDRCFQSLSSLTSEMWGCIAVLYLSWIIFTALGIYLFEVIPQQFGVAKSPLFPIYALMGIFRKIPIKSPKQSQNEHEQPLLHDYTVTEQRNRIKEIAHAADYPLICREICKMYGNGKNAVDRLDLKVADRQIFGLLGPNGAGKTTLLSMITGIFKATSGEALVGGYDIATMIDKVHLQMGVCPQFDIHWPILTVEEHLLFYARLKGIPKTREKAKVQEVLEEVNLVPQRSFMVNTLSGGMKRRLSVAISLVGDPRIVFMDEPTTGLDPKNRRHLWQVLSKCKTKRSLFLTTHLMEEAEALCDRIGIITNGHIRTLGEQQLLKDLYGKDYIVSISVEMEKGQAEDHSAANAQKLKLLKKRLLVMFPEMVVEKEINGLIKISIGGEAKVSQILQKLQKAETNGVKFQWAISLSSLEDVFLQVVRKFDGGLILAPSLITEEEFDLHQ